MAEQEGPRGIRVTWTPSSDATGYIISYTNGSSSDSVTVDGGSTDSHTLTGLQNGATYTISIVATSQHFFSDAVTVNMVVGLGECIHTENVYIPNLNATLGDVLYPIQMYCWCL